MYARKSGLHPDFHLASSVRPNDFRAGFLKLSGETRHRLPTLEKAVNNDGPMPSQSDINTTNLPTFRLEEPVGRTSHMYLCVQLNIDIRVSASY